MKEFDHRTLAERVIALEVAFAKLMDTQCSPEQVTIIKDAFPRTPIGRAWNQWLKREMAKSAALTSADNRKILWLAMQTAPWLNCPLRSTQADILAELESSMYPEYDGDKVTFTEWGWQTPEGEIRYLPNDQTQQLGADK